MNVGKKMEIRMRSRFRVVDFKIDERMAGLKRDKGMKVKRDETKQK